MIQIDEHLLDVEDCLKLYSMLLDYNIDIDNLRQTIVDKLPEKLTVELTYNKNDFISMFLDEYSMEDIIPELIAGDSKIKVQYG